MYFSFKTCNIMKINEIIEVISNRKKFYVTVTIDDDVEVQPLVEVELDRYGKTAIVSVQFIGNDGELSDKITDDIEDFMTEINWDRFFFKS